MNSDKEWENLGEHNPYYGVLTHPEFERRNLDAHALEAFFASGENYLAEVIRIIKRYLAPDFAPARCLDFGCGVGRLVIPMARRYPQVVGVDISPGMLAEAALNCRRFGLNNVTLVQSDDDLSRVTGKFDLINSYIVLQHIAPRRGEVLLQRLLGLLAEGGVGALHVTYDRPVPPGKRFTLWARAHLPLGRQIANLLRGRPLNEALMQMHEYNLNHVFAMLQETGLYHPHIELIQSWNYRGALIFVQKSPAGEAAHQAFTPGPEAIE
jgi:SAM-dependent methyltransferase